MRLLILLVLTLLLSGCGGKGNSPPPQPSNPIPPVEEIAIAPPRRKIYFTFFGCDDNVDETFPFINVYFEACWGDPFERMKRAKAAGVPAIFVLSGYLLTPVTTGQSAMQLLPEATARTNLITLFDRLVQDNTLDNVIAFFVCDEPELVGLNDSDILLACNITRAIAATYPELQGVKLAINYGDSRNFPGISYPDWVGLDSYDWRETIFNPDGIMTYMRTLLKPDQKVILFPGGCDDWKQNPIPFYDYANNDEQVVAIVSFIWLDNWANQGKKGIQGNNMRDLYVKLGTLLKAS